MNVRINLIFGSFLNDNLCYVSAREELILIFIFDGHPLDDAIYLYFWKYIFQQIEYVLFKLRFILFCQIIAIDFSLLGILVFFDPKVNCAAFVV